MMQALRNSEIVSYLCRFQFLVRRQHVLERLQALRFRRVGQSAADVRPGDHLVAVRHDVEQLTFIGLVQQVLVVGHRAVVGVRVQHCETSD